MNKAAFLIIGAAKSGTSTLYYYLNEHPDIVMSQIKEPNYFALSDPDFDLDTNTTGKEYAKDFVFNNNEYSDLFRVASKKQLCGEASPIYLWYKNSAQNIYNYNKNMKIIVILRDPVYRAFSNFNYHLKAGHEVTKNFKKALSLEKDRIKQKYWWGYYYMDAGYYYKQLKRYYDVFGKENIKVFLYEELIGDFSRLYTDILIFLNLRNQKISKIEKTNASYTPKIYLIRKLMKHTKFKKIIGNIVPQNIRSKIKIYNMSKSILNENDKIYLYNKFKNDIRQLEVLIEKKISWGGYNI